MNKFIISGSVLSSDFAHIEEQVKKVEAAGVDWLHIDVIDGVFAPNITMGPIIVEACRKISNMFIDVHLMIVKPDNHIEAFQKAGANSITVHIEDNPHIHRTIQNIHALGCKAGIAINPGTSVTMLDQILYSVDMVLVMSVNPGFSGQKFIPECIDKVKALNEIISSRNLPVQIQVDGGINAETLPLVYAEGARNFVAGNALFKNPGGLKAGEQSLRISIK